MNLEEMKKKSEAIDLLTNMLAETGNKDFIIMKKHGDFTNTFRDVFMEDRKELTEEQKDQMISLFEQFTKLLKDIVK